MILSDVEYKVWETPDLLCLIKKELLEKEIYKKELDSSRLKNLYSGEREAPHGLSVITAHVKDEIIGVITCEHQKFTKVPAITLKDPFRLNSKVKSTEAWSCIALGFIGVYIKKEYRNKGVASSLLRKMEDHRIKTLSPTIDTLDVPFFVAAEAAVKLVKNASKYAYVSTNQEKTVWYHQGIHEITQAAKTHRYGEKYFGNNAPMKDLIKKIDFKYNP